MRLQIARGTRLILVSILCLPLVSGCGGEPGRVRATKDEIIGVYEAKFQKGVERLELKRDGGYIQAFTVARKTMEHTGTWRLETHFLGKSDVILLDALVSEDDTNGVAKRTGDRTLNVHKRSGKLELAINEVADWYFVRVG